MVNHGTLQHFDLRTRNGADRENVERLRDQLRVVKEAQAIHLNRRLLDEMAFYPAHDARRETPEYRSVHQKLTVDLDLPCLICGVKRSTLNNPTENRFGAKQMETHHHVVEWALANAIDPVKFNQRILPHLKVRHPNRADYQKDFTAEQVSAWVDHDPDNLWVLCDVHHRAKYLGIHEISMPIWGPMDLLRSDFEDYVQGQIKAAEEERAAAK